MRWARVLLVLVIACSEQETSPRDLNPNLTVEPIAMDAGVEKAPARTKKRIGMGDHRRREDEDMKEYRRRKAQAQAEAHAETANVESDTRKQDEERRHEAEREHLSNAPLDVYTNPSGQVTPLQTR
jgi:hypothetical protein